MNSFTNFLQKYQLQIGNNSLKRIIRDELFVYERIRVRVAKIKKEYEYTVIEDPFFVNQYNINMIVNHIKLLECEISFSVILLEDLNREFHRSYNSQMVILYYPNYCDIISLQIHRACCMALEETGAMKVWLKQMEKIECENLSDLTSIKKVLKSQTLINDNCHVGGCMTCYSYVSPKCLDLNQVRKEVRNLLIELRLELKNNNKKLINYFHEKLELCNDRISMFSKECNDEVYMNLHTSVISKIKKHCFSLHSGIQEKRVVGFDKIMSERDKKSLKFCLFFHADGNIFIGRGSNLLCNGECYYHVDTWVLVNYHGDCVFEDEMTKNEISWARGELLVRFNDVAQSLNADGFMIIG
jgi:hypothetical protein